MKRSWSCGRRSCAARSARTGALSAAVALASASSGCTRADPGAVTGRASVSSRPVGLFDGRVIPAMPELLGMRAQYEVRLEWLAEKRALLLDQMRAQGSKSGSW